MMFECVSANVKEYLGVVLPLDENLTQGDTCKIIGTEFTVRQAGGGILTMTTDDIALTFMRKAVQPPPEPSVISDSNKLRINKEVDLFFETKEIRLNVGQGYLTELGLTYDALFKFLMKEWKTIAAAFPEHKAVPMEHEDEHNYCLINGWNWFADYNTLLKDGCWSRKNEQGRHV